MGVAANDCAKASTITSHSRRNTFLRAFGMDRTWARTNIPMASHSPEIGVGSWAGSACLSLSDITPATLNDGFRFITSAVRHTPLRHYAIPALLIGFAVVAQIGEGLL